MDRLQYLLVMAACVLVTLPLEIAGARVYRRPVWFVKAVLPAAAVFLVWDAIAIAAEVWDFNARYVTGIVLPFGIPLEELVFFLVIPVCALLTYETVDRILTGVRERGRERT